jgi:hypothetical protein
MEEKSEGEKALEIVVGFHSLLASWARAISQKYGDEGLAVLRDAMKEHHLKKVFPILAPMAGARVGDGGIEDWARMEEFLSKDLPGCEYEMKVTPERGMMRVTSCPVAGAYKETFPEACPKVIIGFEEAIAGTVNPNLKVRVDRYLTLGASSCDIICEWK